MLLLQLTAYGSVVVIVLFIQIKKLGVASFSKAKRKDSDREGNYSLVETFVIGVRLFISACFGAFSALFATKALMLYDNIYVLAMLPVRFGPAWRRKQRLLTGVDFDVCQ